MVIQNDTRSDSKERPKQNPIDSESLIKLKMLLQGQSHGSERHIDDRKGINAYGRIEERQFFSARNLSAIELGNERANRLARSEGSLQTIERSNQPSFVKNPRYARRFKGTKRAIVKKFQKDNERQKHSSLTDLVKCGSAPTLGVMSSTNDVKYYKNLVEKQEAYILQLEKENAYCRDQITSVLSQLGTNKSLGEDDEFIIPFRGESSGNQQLTNLEAENAALRHQLQSQSMNIQSQEHNRNIIDSLRADNEMLDQALNQLTQEADEVKKREAEAAEEVKRSVSVAEHSAFRLKEAMHEIGQLKLQVERLQGKNRALMEEQVDTIEKERVSIEKQFHTQTKHIKEELEKQGLEVGRLKGQITQFQRTEQELNLTIKQKDGYIDDIRKDMDKQLCQFQMEAISLSKHKQKLEMEVKRVNIDLENTADASLSERKRLEEEIGGLRSRLDSTQSMLNSSRQEALNIAEAKAGLERELNLIRGQCGVPALPNLDFYPAKDGKSTNNVPSVDLRDHCNKQTRIIDELKSQCLMATDKLEALSKRYQKEKAQYEYSLAVLMRQTEGIGNHHSMQSQPVMQIVTGKDQANDNTAVIEWLCRQLEKVETDNNNATEQVQRLLGEKHTKSVEIAMLRKELKEVKNSSFNPNSINQRPNDSSKFKAREEVKPNPYDRYAITIVNSKGKVTSPFENKK